MQPPLLLPPPLLRCTLAQEVGVNAGSEKAGSCCAGTSDGWQRRGSYLIDDTKPTPGACSCVAAVSPGAAPPPMPMPPLEAAEAARGVGSTPSTTTMLLRGTSSQLLVERHSGSEEITTLVWGSMI